MSLPESTNSTIPKVRLHGEHGLFVGLFWGGETHLGDGPLMLLCRIMLRVPVSFCVFLLGAKPSDPAEWTKVSICASFAVAHPFL